MLSDTWSDEARAAVDALEEKYDISVCSVEHLESWVNRCERLEAALRPFSDFIKNLSPQCPDETTMVEHERMTIRVSDFRRARDTMLKY